VKGGSDDLRQDAIMEQVFEQVSVLLQSNRLTRQRNLGIRTYKVLPLTPSAGIIEFVPNTIPLHDYSMPAHARHFPKDWKPAACRKVISDAQSKSQDTRLKAYKTATDHFHPVLRYFFLDRYNNPDDWFERRLAYSRSTAAISILGHVLGLGDRHGHNILLDEKTGEVVHIDLGVAFETVRLCDIHT
jgi:serine-protein kinase ATM